MQLFPWKQKSSSIGLMNGLTVIISLSACNPIAGGATDTPGAAPVPEEAIPSLETGTFDPPGTPQTSNHPGDAVGDPGQNFMDVIDDPPPAPGLPAPTGAGTPKTNTAGSWWPR